MIAGDHGQRPRGALIDVDGVLLLGDVAIPGAVRALGDLRARGVPFRLLTNTTVRSRGSLGAQLRRRGFDAADAEVITAGAATAAFVRRRFPGVPCYLLASADVRVDFDGVPLVEDASARVVVVGDAGERFDYHSMNHAFRLLAAGAALVAMQRNRYWLTREGPTLDAGAWVRALEYAAERRATVVGKPAAPFFRAGFRSLGCRPGEVVMVGDDVRQDVLPAMRLGARGVLVRTGKYREEDLRHGRPDVVLDSVVGLPDLFPEVGPRQSV
ncbi:MAG TPA: TIGR01458 family HAD-type hydrolase [Thermomicrobiaceae bacterium]|nr:TIGR01458 family HAD-type hydrolase [Thermomicrobiaceae bacterium]